MFNKMRFNKFNKKKNQNNKFKLVLLMLLAFYSKLIDNKPSNQPIMS